MSLYTTFLKLFKYNLETDKKNTFNIQLCLNDNWDKIENFARNISEQITSNYNSLNTLITNLKTTVTSNYNSLNNNKSNVSLSNIIPTSSVLIKLTNSMCPVYEQKYSILSGWTSSEPCLIHILGSPDTTTIVTINDSSFQISFDSGDGQSSASAQYLIGANTTITYNTCRQAFAVPLRFSY